MALHPIAATQFLAAFYSRLTTSALTSAYRIYNYAPPSATFPYVSIGGMIYGKSAEFTSRDLKGEDLVIHAHVWSSYQGDSEVSTMMDNISQAITGSDLSITEYTQIKLITDFAQVLIDTADPNLILRHGVIRFRAQVG